MQGGLQLGGAAGLPTCQGSALYGAAGLPTCLGAA